MKVSGIIDVGRGLIGPVTPDSPVAEANALMAEHHVGALAVIDANGLLAGILSERDIARGLHEHGTGLLDKSVGDLMVRKVISCTPDTDVRDATSLMIQHGIRHLPVLDGETPLTIISIRDIVATRLGSLEIDNEILRAQLQELSSGGG
ncbi:MAG: CBS domain-containing protein [Alphaproteobacteria bacterium]